MPCSTVEIRSPYKFSQMQLMYLCFDVIRRFGRNLQARFYPFGWKIKIFFGFEQDPALETILWTETVQLYVLGRLSNVSCNFLRKRGMMFAVRDTFKKFSNPRGKSGTLSHLPFNGTCFLIRCFHLTLRVHESNQGSDIGSPRDRLTSCSSRQPINRTFALRREESICDSPSPSRRLSTCRRRFRPSSGRHKGAQA
ncbi:hypothetical protein TcWFU_001319 [Taenia crassiceps]|uniref:Uncharacterized protein n=1 Tax=Taenia crassiceps TaxID=6207 RepID=A0ABR4QFU8_9CEST